MPAADAAPNIEVLLASAEQAPLLDNLLELYIHDFSEFFEVPISEDGRFHYPQLDLYWSDPDRHALLIRANGRLAGLSLIKRCTSILSDRKVWDMAEFFVLRGCRRMGIGKRVVQQLWTAFPGPWEVRVMTSNVPAQEFWARAIEAFLGEQREPTEIDKDGKRWRVFSFESLVAESA